MKTRYQDSPGLAKPVKVQTQNVPGRVRQKFAKPTRVRDGSYLEWLHTKPCCVHGSHCDGPIEAAHISLYPGEKSAASKVSDYYALPVCRPLHLMVGGNLRKLEALAPFYDTKDIILRHLIEFLEQGGTE